jgi:protein pelota
VVIFSSMHESGQREFPVAVYGMKVLMCTLELNQLTGIAAILTFPLDVEVVEQEEKEAEEERQREAAETAGSA